MQVMLGPLVVAEDVFKGVCCVDWLHFFNVRKNRGGSSRQRFALLGSWKAGMPGSEEIAGAAGGKDGFKFQVSSERPGRLKLET
jgi:hypothetical protein